MAVLPLAVKAWCEIFGVTPPSEASLDEATHLDLDHWLTLLRSGKGVKRWNDEGLKLVKQLAEGKLDRLDLSGAPLKGIDLRKLQLKRVNLSGANLSRARLFQTRLVEADLSGAHLERAFLEHASLASANLQGAQLVEAAMCYCSLKSADCRGANFRNARLGCANLCGADLTGASFKDADLSWAKYDEHTKFPKNLRPTARRMKWAGKGTSPEAARQAAQ